MIDFPPWNDECHLSVWEPHVGELIRFVPKAELERIRLVREARAIYDSIFPPNGAISARTATANSDSPTDAP